MFIKGLNNQPVLPQISSKIISDKKNSLQGKDSKITYPDVTTLSALAQMVKFKGTSAVKSGCDPAVDDKERMLGFEFTLKPQILEPEDLPLDLAKMRLIRATLDCVDHSRYKEPKPLGLTQRVRRRLGGKPDNSNDVMLNNLKDAGRILSENPSALADLLVEAGDILIRRGEQFAAIPLIERAISIYDRHGEKEFKELMGMDFGHEKTEVALCKLGLILVNRGQPKEAKIHLERYFEISGKALFDPEHEKLFTSTLNILASMYYQEGDDNKTLRCLDDVVEIYRHKGDSQADEAACNNIAKIYLEHNNLELAERYLEPLYKRFHDSCGDTRQSCRPSVYLSTLYNLATLRLKQDKKDEAKMLIKEAQDFVQLHSEINLTTPDPISSEMKQAIQDKCAELL